MFDEDFRSIIKALPLWLQSKPSGSGVPGMRILEFLSGFSGHDK